MPPRLPPRNPPALAGSHQPLIYQDDTECRIRLGILHRLHKKYGGGLRNLQLDLLRKSCSASHRRVSGSPTRHAVPYVTGRECPSSPPPPPRRPARPAPACRRPVERPWRQSGPEHHPDRGRVAEATPRVKGSSVAARGTAQAPGIRSVTSRAAVAPAAVARNRRRPTAGEEVGVGVSAMTRHLGVTGTGLSPTRIRARWHDRVTEAARRRTLDGRTGPKRLAHHRDVRPDRLQGSSGLGDARASLNDRSGSGGERAGERRGAGGYARERVLRARAISRSASRLATVWRLS
jgi:hypothetical protein